MKQATVSKPLTVLQVLPALESGGVERGTLEVGGYLASKGHRSMVLSAGGRLVSQLIQEGSEHITLAIGKKSLLTFGLVPKLIQLFRQEKVDIVHVRSRFPAWVITVALALMPKSQRPALVSTVHGQYSVSAYSAVMTKADAVIVVSKHIKHYVQSHYPNATKPLYLNYRGIAPEHFPYQYQPRPDWLTEWHKSYPHLQGKFVIMLPGRLTRWKGQEDLLRIMAILKSHLPQAHALIVGEAKAEKQNYLAELKQLVDTLDLADWVTFTGHRSDVREIMAVSDIVLSLSHEPEAFGRVSMEALAMGVPVIGYAHGGVGEQLAQVFPEGQVKPKNYKAAARLVQQWFQQSPTVEKTEAFRLQTMLENTLQVYQNVMQKRRETRT